MKVKQLKSFLDDYLNVAKIEDTSLNGLQVGDLNNNISQVGFAVDASLKLFKTAAKEDYNFLIVHHGLFWGEPFPIIGLNWERFKVMIENKLNLYAAHLPLDLHSKIGHNAQMVKILKLENVKPFGNYKGTDVGFCGEFEKKKSVPEMEKLLKKLLGKYTFLDFGKDRIKTVAIVSGGAASLIPEAIEKNIDLYITGEPSHSLFHFIKEGKLNVVYGGHYKTETFGLLALQKLIEVKFNLKTKFFDIPTGF
jgi:dinuclear metal center YbgI/SA1388 family protein